MNAALSYKEVGSFVRGPRRRGRQDPPRTRSVRVRVSEHEYELLAAAAAASGRLSVGAYLVLAGLNGGAGASGPGWTIAQRRALGEELYGVRRGLSGACANLNRLTRIGQGQDRVPPEVPETAKAIERFLPRLERLMNRMNPDTVRKHPEGSSDGEKDSA